MLMNKLTELKNSCTEDEFKEILNVTTKNIIANRLSSKRITSQKDFLKVLNITTKSILNL